MADDVKQKVIRIIAEQAARELEQVRDNVLASLVFA